MNPWPVILVALVFSAFFSGMEIAFISSNKLRIELDRNRGLLSARILSSFVKKPSRILGTFLLGNNIALVVYGIAMASVLEPFIIKWLPDHLISESVILLVQTVISTLFILFFAEFLPKVLFRINSNAILNFFAVPVQVIYILLYPVVLTVIGLSELILRKLFRMKFTAQDYAFSPVDLDHFLKEFSPDQEEKGDLNQELQIFQNAIEFRKVRLRECLVPRTEMVAIDKDASIRELRDKFIESGHSKILVYHENTDHIIGYTHSYDLFTNPETITSIIRHIPIVPETMLANTVLKMLLKEQKSVAVVVDEFGGTSGLVTMEDLIEEIFGEIEDEYDTEELVERKISEREFLFSARLEIDYLNEKYHLGLPESDEYETLGGLIIHIQQSIPRKGDRIIMPPVTFIIEEAGDTRIEEVRLILSV
ncbi:MAG: HlyC/CorC family transporter [Bacteroidales bacterium]|nr:HlyC/CorC family transporter [Bacteroidales bacterium]